MRAGSWLRTFAALPLLSACMANAPDTEPQTTGAAISAEPADPAVIHANAIGNPAQPYSEGYSGEGDERIHYVVAGEGPTVLFVHGFPSFWYTWFDQMEAFKACRRVIAIDALGAGLSAKPEEDEPYRIANLAQRLDELIAELAPDEKIALVGHDWGGALVWSYAENDASRLDRLAVFSAPPHDLFMAMLSDDPEQRAASRYMPVLANLSREQISSQQAIERIYGTGYGRMVQQGVLTEQEGALFKAALSYPGALAGGAAWYRANVPPFDQIDVTRDAWPAPDARAEVPTLLVRGETDKTFVKAMEVRAQAHAKELTVVTLDGVGHSTPYQDPEAASLHLGTFLGLDGGQCPG